MKMTYILKIKSIAKNKSICSMHSDKMHKDIFLCLNFNNISKEAYIVEWVFDMDSY